jgi:hypothetical protein
MKYTLAFLILAGIANGQQFHLERSNGKKSYRVDFDPYSNQTRTIHIDYSSGRPVVTSDVTIPEGVGYIYLRSGNKAVIEYSPTPFVDNIRILQSLPANCALVLPVYGF